MVRVASKATKGKGKRWQKGSSSTCNPESKKHRSRVQEALLGGKSSNVVSGNNQNFKLTKDLLEKFDAIQQQKLRLQENVQSDEPSTGIDQWVNVQRNRFENNDAFEEPDDTKSLGAVTAASVWTNCTNVTFDRFLTGFDSKSKMHKAMLAVLATIREAIELENGSETETEYFAGLMLALNVVENEEKLTATIALIQMVLRKVPGSVLKLKFAETASTMLKILHDRIESSNGYLIKSIIKSLAHLMQEQEEPAWESTIATKTFQMLLELILHPKPRIRKAAHFAVNAIINTKKTEPSMVARKLLAQFCISKLERHLTTSQDQHLQSLLYISTLMSDTFHRFPNVEACKKATETILSHLTFGNVLVINGAFQMFYNFFRRRPDSQVISPELNAQLLNALYDYQPNINDEQPLNAWLLAMREGLLSLHCLSRPLSHAHLFKFVKCCVQCFSSDSKQVQVCAAGTIKALFDDVVVQIEFDHDKRARFFEEVELALKYQYANSWLRVVPMIGSLQLPVTSSPNGEQYLTTIWQRLAILHEPKHSELNSAIDSCLSQSVKFFGPRAVLKQVPVTWQATETEHAMEQWEAEIRGEFTNAWMLPILRDSIGEKGELGLFSEHFLPLAEELSKKSALCAKWATKLRQEMNQSMETEGESNDAKFKAHEAILVTSKELKRCVHASWSLLPALCRSPIDAPAVFPKIAKKLGEVFYDREFMSYPANALRNLFKNQEPSTMDVLAKFAKNYLPILFNIYTNEQEIIEDGQRAMVLAIMEQFMPLLFRTEDQTALFTNFYEKIKERLRDASCSEFRRKALLDMLKVFLSAPRGLKRQDIEELYNSVAVPLIVDGEKTFDQKKGFRIIEQILLSESEEVKKFVCDNLKNILNFLHELLTTKKRKAFTSPATTACAMRTLNHLVTLFRSEPEMGKQLFNTFLPVIFKAMVLKSTKARRMAEELLLTIFDAAEQLPEDSHALLMAILQPLRSSDAEMHVDERTSRVLAISFLYTRRYHQKSAALQCDIADEILAQMTLAQNDAGVTRDVLNVCFDFITLFIKSAKEDTITPYLETLASGLTNLPVAQRTKYRLKIKVLLTKLGRKFGFDVIGKLISEDYRKVLKNIRKLEVAKKNKKGDRDDSSDDENGDNDDDRKSRKSRKSRFMDSDDEEEAELREFVEEEWNRDKDNEMDEDDDDDRQTYKSKKLDIMSRISTKTTKSFFKEDTDADPIDLLSASASKQIFSKIPKKFQSSTEAEDGEETTATLVKKLPIAEDGRIKLGELLNRIEKSDKYTDKSSLKRGRDDSDAEEAEDDDNESDANGGAKSTKSGKSRLSYKHGGHGIHRAVSVSGKSVKSTASKKSKKSTSGKSKINQGDAYRSKKAAGDMKRANMPDPFAYIPMNAMQLNKRKQMKNKSVFKGVVEGARKGAAAGARKAKRMRKQ